MTAARPRTELRHDLPGASVRRLAPAQASRRPSPERRRRERHFRRRRRDLIEDVAIAFSLTIVLLSVTAGLGVLALLELPIAGLVAASIIVERRRAKPTRRHRGRHWAAGTTRQPTAGRSPRH
jgi:hypothetical protein